jgi:hypothetical protein
MQTQRSAGMVGSGTRCRRPSTVDQKLLIFVLGAAHSLDLSLLFVVKPAVVHGNSLETARRVRLGADEYDLVLVGSWWEASVELCIDDRQEVAESRGRSGYLEEITGDDLHHRARGQIVV